MDKNQNHWIALYLSGQYPWKYIMPDRLSFFDEIRIEDSARYNENLLTQFQTKNDIEFYYSLLNSYQRNYWEFKYSDLLDRLEIPNEVKIDPRIKQDSNIFNPLKIQEFEGYMDSLDETGFSRYVIMPILKAMWYEDIEYKGKVNETDFWIDFFPVKFVSPWWAIHYSWIQTKSAKMTNWDTTWSGNEMNKLIEETKTAFNQPHLLNTWEKIFISEYIVFNSKDVSQSAREKYYSDKDIKDKKIRFYWKDWVLSLMLKYNINR